MPRTGVIIGITHEGKTEVIAPESVPYGEQYQQFKESRVQVHHKEFKLIYRVDLSQCDFIRLRSLDEHKEHLDLRAKEEKAAKKAGEKLAKENRELQIRREEARIKREAAELEELNKQNLSAPGRTGAKAEK